MSPVHYNNLLVGYVSAQNHTQNTHPTHGMHPFTARANNVVLELLNLEDKTRVQEVLGILLY
jgi:hypothetical protein